MSLKYEPSSEPGLPFSHGTYKTVTARFWPGRSGKSPRNVLRCSLFALKRDLTDTLLLQPRHARMFVQGVPFLVFPFRSEAGRASPAASSRWRGCTTSTLVRGYRGTSLIRNSAPLGPYSATMPGALWTPRGGAVSYERGTPVLAPASPSPASPCGGLTERVSHLQCFSRASTIWSMRSLCATRSACPPPVAPPPLARGGGQARGLVGRLDPTPCNVC